MALKSLKIISFIFAVIILTIFTQVGGIILLLSWFIYLLFKKKQFKWRRVLGIFIFFYLLCTLILVPLIAPMFGRVNLPATGSPNLVPATILTCLLNRHYVKPELHREINELSSKWEQKFPKSKILYLDANFPFWDGFKLFPHLSHNDGKKLDLALYFLSSNGKTLMNETPTLFGYGYFIEPAEGRKNQTETCLNKGYWQYDFIKHFTFRSSNKYRLDAEKTKYLIYLLDNQKGIGKIFLEPHLKETLGFSSSTKIRFHGCQAVRHDDHIHIQL